MSHERLHRLLHYAGYILLAAWIASGIYLRNDHASMARRVSVVEYEHRSMRDRVAWVEAEQLKLQQQLNRIELKLDLAIASYQLEAQRPRRAHAPPSDPGAARQR